MLKDKIKQILKDGQVFHCRYLGPLPLKSDADIAIALDRRFGWKVTESQVRAFR